MSLITEHANPGIFLLLTCLIGGGAAWLTGRAIATTWRPAWQIVTYALLLGAVSRFFHYALFQGVLVSPHYYLVDTAVLLAAASLGFRMTRARQMATQYPWLYRRTGPLTWAERAPGTGPADETKGAGRT